MEEERERRELGGQDENTNERKRKGKGEKRKLETLEEPYFARSSAGVQILNRILDECISLTRLRPVSTKCCWKRRKQRRVVATTTRGGRRGEGVDFNAIINLCLALRQ